MAKTRREQNFDLDIQTITVIAPYLWQQSPHTLSEEDKGVVLRAAKIFCHENPFSPWFGNLSTPPVDRTVYIQRILETALRLTLRDREIREIETARSTPAALKAFEEDLRRTRGMGNVHLWKRDTSGFASFRELGNHPAPNSTGLSGGIITLTQMQQTEEAVCDSNGDPVRLELAPYDPVFTDHTAYGTYFDRPYYVPHFRLTPRTWSEGKGGKQIPNVLQRTSAGQGKKQFFNEIEVGRANAEVAYSMLDTFADCLAEALPEYLRQFGFWSLTSKYKGLLSDLNRHGLKPREIIKKRDWSRSQYYDSIEFLKRRGWLPIFHQKRNRTVYRYFPVFDNNKAFYSSLQDLQVSQPEALMRLLGANIDLMLYRSELPTDYIDREIMILNSEAITHCRDYQIHKEWDGKLKALVYDMVTDPVPCGAELEDLEVKFRTMPVKKRVELFCAAKKRRVGLWEILKEDMNAIFADILTTQWCEDEQVTENLSDVFGEILGLDGSEQDERPITLSFLNGTAA